jgi:hypothetical protein
MFSIQASDFWKKDVNDFRKTFNYEWTFDFEIVEECGFAHGTRPVPISHTELSYSLDDASVASAASWASLLGVD